MNTRKRLRLPNYDYSQNGAYFFTTCVEGRKPLLSTVTLVGAGSKPAREDISHDDVRVDLTEIGKIVLETWLDLPNHNTGIELGPFVVMPDHVHGILLIDRPDSEPVRTKFTEMLRQFKTFSSRRARQRADVPLPLWQRSFFDRLLRNDEEFNRAAAYIETNPLRSYFKSISSPFPRKESQLCPTKR